MKLFARALALMLAVGCASMAHAQGSSSSAPYPNRPVRVVVPSSPGGLLDVITRVIAQKLSEKLGGQFFIDNVTAGGGNVAMGGVAKAVGDGYTLLIVSSHFVVNPSLIPDTPYDPVKDFAPITLMAVASQVVVVNPSVPANNMKELVALIRANPGKYNYASPGTGTTGHLAGEMFRLAMGLDLVHVPFKGAAPAIQSTVAGHTPIAFVGVPSAAVQMKDGKVRALAISTPHRSPAFPDLVTMAQAGLANQESDVMQGLLAPAGTPKEIVNLLQRTVAEIVAMPDVKARLAAFGFDPVANKPEEFAARIKEESARWAKVIKDANIKMTQ